MKLDHATKQAIRHTFHCLIGCGIGEVLGMVIAASLGWDKVGRIVLAVILAFTFGYLLTYIGVRKHTETASEAVKITLATDTLSIATMEFVANLVELLIPAALLASVVDPVFWYSLLIAMSVAFIITVPVNRFLISRQLHAHHH